MTTKPKEKIGVIIPCYKVKSHILGVIKEIGDEVSVIYVVDDCCPNESGKYVEENCRDERVRVIYNEKNLGVGGATMRGYKEAIKDEIDIVAKVDGDGQMDPKLIHQFVAPIIKRRADYTKGNRFFNPDDVMSMPRVRLIGNAILSFLTKLSSGYWNVFDPTNGYTAIHTDVIKCMALDKIDGRYFFESDILFRLNIIRAVVVNVPMKANYGSEVSNLSIKKIVMPFLSKHLRNTLKRIAYNYYIRDFSFASICLVVGFAATSFGAIYGASAWIESAYHNRFSSSGVVMIATLPIILGMQLILSFINYDVTITPQTPLLIHLDEKRS